MKSIIAKFCSVKKYGVAVSLAAASCFSLMAEINCFSSQPYLGSDGNWYVRVHCSGDVDSSPVEVMVQGQEGCGGGGSGGTNCTAMSVSECLAAKERIGQLAVSLEVNRKEVLDWISSSLSTIEATQAMVKQITDEGDKFVEGKPVNGWGDNNNARWSALNSTPQSSYLYNEYSSVGPAGLNMAAGGVGSIYNYYQSIANTLGDITNNLAMMSEDLGGAGAVVTDMADPIGEFLIISEGMNCTACSVSSGGGESSPSACPCAQFINGVIDAVNNCKSTLDDIKSKVFSIDDRLKKWEKYISQITTSVNALAFMGTNFTYAVQYKTLDGVTFQMDQLDEQLLSKKSLTFDYGEFGNLSWYSRIEYLLMSIAGVFSKTNREDTLTSEALDNAYDDVADRKDSFEATVNNVTSGFDGLHSAINNLMSALSGAVVSGSSSGTITLWASWFGGRGLTMSIPADVISTSRVVFSLLWTLIFSFTMYHIVLNGWVFIVKFIQFWITQTTGFLK